MDEIYILVALALMFVALLLLSGKAYEFIHEIFFKED